MKASEREDLLRTLQKRFEANMHRHTGVKWSDVHAKLDENTAALKLLG